MEMLSHTKKVLLISHSNALGGAELCFVEMAKACYSIGYEVYAVFPKEKEGKLQERCEKLVAESYNQYLPYWTDEGEKYSFKAKWYRLLNIIASVRQSIKIIKKLKPDIVITNTSVSPQYGVAAKLTGKQHIWFVHELVEEDFGQHYIFGKSFTKKLVGYLSNIVLVNSVFVANTYKGLVKSKKLTLLYQPVNINCLVQKEEKADSELKLLIVGKVADFKGQHEAVKATLKILKQGKDVSLTILGTQDNSSPYVQNMKANIDVGFTDKFHFVPFTSSPEEYYMKADILLVCSKCEALGRISIEGMKAGLPVIASNRGGNLELVKDGFNGYLYEYNNPADLADKILQLQNVEVRKVFGENGKKWAEEHFNEEKFRKELDEIIKLV